MKWGRKKAPSSPSPSSSSQPSLISHVFPISWLSKFKHMSINSQPKPGKVKRKGKRNNSPSMTSPQCAGGGSDGRFYGGDDDDAFWRLSFGEEGVNGKKVGGDVLKSVWYDSDDELDVPPASCRSCRSNSNGTKVRQVAKDLEIPLEKETEIRTPRASWTTGKHELLASGSKKHCSASSLNSKNSSLGAIEEDGVLLATQKLEETEGLSPENSGSEWQKLKDKKIEDIKSKNEEKRKSLYVSRESQRRRTKKQNHPRVRAYSPRTASKVEICKIKALEDMRKAKLKMKKKAKETIVDESIDLESFAVVKRSFDPQRDFRDSMVEMIMEKRISQPEEMEQLLACYLTLNSDEYHDLIIKVFRQVWFDLNQTCFTAELQNPDCCYYD